MADYGFVHSGRVFTADNTQGISVEDNDKRNKAIEADELKHWQTQPDRFVAYYSFPAEKGGQPYRAAFAPRLHLNAGVIGTADVATVKTWLGTKLGDIIFARVYRHNFGGRVVRLRVRGTNGAIYYGSASWDSGDVITLRKARR